MNPVRQLAWMMVVLAWLAPRMSGQAPTAREPHMGYVFPAGAKSGSTVEVLVGGQNLRGASQVVVSGTGVSARVLKVYRPVRLQQEVREEIQRRIAARRAVLAGQPVPPDTPANTPPASPSAAKVPPRKGAAKAGGKVPPGTPAPANAPALVMPELVLLDRLPHADAAEIDHMVQIFLRANRMQMNPQLAEMVTLEVTVAPDAVPGVRELRLLTPAGLTNPLRFETGTFAEVCEREPNDPKPGKAAPPQVAELPVVFNGQVFPGDVDRLRFHAHRAQSLVVEVRARSLIPYLADAVPGWFQPVLAVLDRQGKELAYGDDFRFQPDPVVMFRVPEDGDYTLEIRDSIYRGREDFVYRIKVSEQPFVTACFPLGAAAGSTTSARLSGWNLPRTDVVLDARPGGTAMRAFTVANHGMVSNPVAYAVDDLPDAAENEPNDDRDHARALPWPCVVNGRIHKSGDIDVFRLAAPAGTPVVMEVWARHLGSPLDSVLRVTNAAGKVLAWNDDMMPKDGQLQLGDGLLTHHADSRVCWTVPDQGPYFVQIEDAQHQGGDAFAYRLRIAPAKPDFALRVTPSALNLAPGQSLPVTVHVDRRGGFAGAVTVGLAKASAGWSLSGNVIAPDHERMRMTVQAPPDATPGVMPLDLTGTAEVGGVATTRVAEACDDTMQAFLWRHLVPARECLTAIMAAKPRVSSAQRIGLGPVEIPSGGEAVVRFRVPVWIARQGVEMTALEAPDGLALRSETLASGVILTHLTADATKLKPGYADNLIAGALLTQQPLAKDGKPQARARSGAAPVVVLPAVPFIIREKSTIP